MTERSTRKFQLGPGDDPASQALRDRYEAALKTRLDRHFSPWRPAKLALVGVAGLAGCLVCGSLAMTEPGTTPPAVRALLALFACFGLGWTLLAVWAIAKGQGGLLAQRMAAARMAFGFTLATVIGLSLATVALGRATNGMPMLVTGLALLIVAAVVLVGQTIERAESTIREQILRLEFRLIDLAESGEPRRDS